MLHLAAITRRADAVFQTATVGGRHMARTDTAQLSALRTEQAGLYLTRPLGSAGAREWQVPVPPVFADAPKRSVGDAVRKGPGFFRKLMNAAGSVDGRDVARELGRFYAGARCAAPTTAATRSTEMSARRGRPATPVRDGRPLPHT